MDIDNKEEIYYDIEPEEEYEIDDDSGINYAQADNYKEEEGEAEKAPRQVSVFGALLKVLFAPTEGWRDVRRNKLTVAETQSNCFYPLLAVLAASNFISLVYNHKTTVTEIVVKGMIDFVSFFFGYFCILIGLKIFLPSKLSEIFNTEYGKVYIILSLSSLCIFSIFATLLPMVWPVLFFLPLWTIFAMCRGMRYFKLPERGSIRFTLWTCLLVVGVPVLIDRMLTLIIPG